MRKEEITARLQYIRDVFAPEDDLLKSIRNSAPESVREIQLGAEEAQILEVLIALSGAKKIVEIGVLAGYSASCMAKALSDDGIIYAIEKSEEMAKIIRENIIKAGNDKKIKLLVGDALEILPFLEDKAPFDMVFIDADKGNYCKYLDWAEKNVRLGGLIIGDNTFLFGGVYGGNERKVSENSKQAMLEFNSRLADKSKYTSILLPTVEGMTVAVKRF